MVNLSVSLCWPLPRISLCHVTGAVSEHGAALPEFVFAPAHPVERQGRRDLAFEVRQAEDGSAVLPVFTTIDRLVATLGSHQPWVRLPLRAARALVGAAGVRHVVLDPVQADENSLWTQADLETLEAETS
jgi:hypothetical protein